MILFPATPHRASRRSPFSLLPALLLACLTAACGSETSAEDSGPTGEGLVHVVQQDESPERPGFFDFGTVPHGDLVHHSFLLKNSDPRPVTIQDIVVGCGCTVARLSKRTVDGEVVGARGDLPNVLLVLEPGEVAEISLEVDTTEIRVKNIDKLFMVRVTSDSIATPYTTLEVHLVVQLDFQVAPEGLELPLMPQGAGETRPITIKPVGTRPGRITGVREVPPGVVAELRESELSRPGFPVWVLEAGFAPPLELGRHAATIILDTEGDEGVPTAPVEIQIAGTAVADLRLHPSRLVLRPGQGASDPEDPSAALIGAQLETFLPGHRFGVTGFQILGEAAEHLEFVAEPVLPDARGQSTHWNLRLSTRTPGPNGSFTGTVRLELDDPQHPTIDLPYVGLDFDS